MRDEARKVKTLLRAAWPTHGPGRRVSSPAQAACPWEEAYKAGEPSHGITRLGGLVFLISD